MSEQTRAILKTYFETGDRPTEQEFINLIDSMLNIKDDGFGGWQSITLSYTAWQPGAVTSKYINAIPVPAGYQINRIVIIPETSFRGGTVASCFVRLFESSDTYFVDLSDTDVYTALTNTTGNICSGVISHDRCLSNLLALSYIRARLTVTGAGATINSLTQGSIKLYYRLDKLYDV